jgi:hypothetical protein
LDVVLTNPSIIQSVSQRAKRSICAGGCFAACPSWTAVCIWRWMWVFCEFSSRWHQKRTYRISLWYLKQEKR